MKAATVGATLAVFCVAGTTAHGQCEPGETSTVFAYTGALQTYTVPAGVPRLRLVARGADGGNGGYASCAVGVACLAGGAGATIRGLFDIAEGTALQVLVGEAGESALDKDYGAGGGGGGSFVARGESGFPDFTPADLLVAAGGGGGRNGANSPDNAGGGGGIGLSAGGGANGYEDPTYGPCGGAGGGGLLGNGLASACGLCIEKGQGGVPIDSGAAGGTVTRCSGLYSGRGGFGGGGGSSYLNYTWGGGGGGYGGGAGGGFFISSVGGTSFNAGLGQSNIAGGTNGGTESHGEVVICELPHGIYANDHETGLLDWPSPGG